MIRILLYAAAIAAGSGVAAADEESGRLPQPIQEFFVTENAYPQEKGEVQLTISGSFFHQRHQRSRSLALSAEYGLSDRFQLEATLPYLWRSGSESARGLGGPSFGALYNVIPGNAKFAASLAFETTLPAMDEEASWELAFLAARAFGLLQLHAGLGVEIEDGETSATYHLAVVRPFKRFSPTLELSGSHSGEKSTLFVTPGVYYRLAEGVEVGGGFPYSLHGRGHGAIVKATWEF